MGDDASLEEFLGDKDGEPATETEPAGESAEESVEPATTTYEFVPDGAECASCGRTVDRRWQQDGSLVCEECTDW
ncbi:hypothetical protein HLRTI_000381 [Halorhabdus tiamatea SARL4B]|uniref:DUF7573 domain-containing protein n=1 Tax=Halorhabdus tiamatea SARL4B TaxID=1033806 RepID=F7PK93_9EURY|nr:hypothetical protein [Halorhabdus tiamatea]ERJ07628.1 hypothetical protein HLRTI_000381 [Halorhabdus tiamatea SARL4B]CCQ33420.1 hypothetical protein HTIA_1286 [Halorhabdus tiamatea SARL4B]